MFVCIATVLLDLIQDIPMAHDLCLTLKTDEQYWGLKASMCAIRYLPYPIIKDGLYNM